ncbi:MAG: methionine adenosyltransferase domain-containing protein, partial [Terriglobia bacterium]
AAVPVPLRTTVSIMVESFGTALLPEEQIIELIRNHFALTPKGMIGALDLLRPIYQKTAAYGHFGRTEKEFTWERTDKAEALRRAAGLGEMVAAKRP